MQRKNLRFLIKDDDKVIQDTDTPLSLNVEEREI